MKQLPIIMPQLGESIAEATIINFLIKPGDVVAADQDVIEVETNKATMNVSSPCGGKVVNLTARLNESYPVGATLGHVEISEEEAARLGLDQSVPEEQRPASNGSGNGGKPGEREASRVVEPTVRGLPVPANAGGASYMSPRMKARMAELGLHAADLAGVSGSGAAGRVTIQDFEKFLDNLEKHKLSTASSMRVAVADAMRRSWARPLATVALPCSLEAMLAHRKKTSPKIGPALYAVRALAIALGENSAPAGRLIGNKIVHPPSIDVGFAVEADDGVLVPVLRNADVRPLSDLVIRYDELVALARQRRLPPEATGGSIATVTNFGTFGLTWATPIPLPEQTLVLGIGAGKKTPFWDEAKNQFVPVMEANLTLSFDHRVLDGGAAGRLLAHIAALLQQPGKL
ncbi:MAG TPA: dihydrolipoamide acetyltransferase family protein [Verrucomicrobiae bacterium]|jgi:pyruvate/2-oxoglutarate dehydrogenase complex dihydrolipoamide acyltransferase (E2) component|nr:dihydrolipoamide acetyltransferase family protein [Verrucomicrobiae bacterium]